jgi:zinc protease
VEPAVIYVNFFINKASALLRLASALLICAAFSAPLVSRAQTSIVSPLPPKVEKVQTVEGITEYKLANGLRILLAPDASDQRVTVNVTYMVGSRHEGYGETGMAHLLEHLIFKGTPQTPDPKAEFSKRGFSFNGTTSHDRTNYFATFQSKQADVDWYIGWQADAMVNSFIARKDLDSEMTVVRNEYERAESSASSALFARMGATAYMWHNYGKPTIGAMSDIENVDIASLQAFYRRHYRPDNAMLMVAGKFDAMQTLASVVKAFGDLAAPATPLVPTYTLDTAQDGERSVVVRRPATTQLLVSSYHAPAALHPDTAPLQVLNQVLADVPSGRLNKALVDSQLAQSAFASASFRREASTLYFGANLGVDDEAGSRQKVLLDIVEGMAAQPVTAPEFERALARLTKSMELGFANAAAVANGAIESAAIGDWRSVFVSRDRLAKVTLDDVNRVAKTYLVPSNRTFGHLIPTDKPSRTANPQPFDAAAYMQGYALKAEGESSVEFDYSIPNIQKLAPINQLSQGIKVSVLTKPVRGDVVTLRMALQFGSLSALAGRQAPAVMVNSLLMRGTPKYNRQQIQDELVRLGAQVGFSLSAQGGIVSITVKKERFAQTLDFAMHLLKASNFPAKDFDEIKANWIKSIEGQIQDKASQASNTFGRYGNPYPKDDIRYSHTLEEWLAVAKAVTREETQKFHADFYGSQGARVVVVGPVVATEVRAQLAAELEPWRAAQAWQRVPYPLVTKPPARLVFDTPDKANATLSAYLQFPLMEPDVENWQLSLATRIFGGGPGSRLWTRMREQSGLSYSVSAGMSASMYDKRAGWTMSSDIAPANLSTAEATMREELSRSLAKGFTEEEFSQFKTQWLTERARSRSGDGFAMGLLLTKQELDRDWDMVLKNDALIASITLEQVNAVWRKYIAPEQLVWGVFADAAKSK